MSNHTPANRGLKVWIMAMRLRTLPAAGGPLVLGAILAHLEGGLHWGATLSAVASALLIQIGTNFANDYYDHQNGADTPNRLGPTRVTQSGLVDPNRMKHLMIATFGLAALFGIYLIYRGGFPIVVIGTLSILFGITYTGGPKPLGYIGLGDILVLIFFGPVATAGMTYVNTLSWNPNAAVLGLALGFMSTAILVVNNLRDIDEDRSTGKHTLVARFGPGFGRWEYAICIIGGCALSSIWSVSHGRAWAAVASGVVALTGLRLIKQVWRRCGRELNPLLGQTGRLLLALALGLSLGWTIG